MDAFDGISQGTILHQSSVSQIISAPVFFDDNGRVAIVETRSFGGISLSNTLQLGADLTSLNLSGGFTAGVINVNGNITGIKPINVGLNGIGDTKDSTRVFLRGDNTGFTGKINIGAGSLSVKNSNALGISGENIEISPKGWLELDSTAITLTGKFIKILGGRTGFSSIINRTGNNTIASNITLAANSQITALNGTTFQLGNIGCELASITLTLFNDASSLTTKMELNGTIGTVSTPLQNQTKSGSGILYIKSILNLSGVLRIPNNSNTPIDVSSGDISTAPTWQNNTVE